MTKLDEPEGRREFSTAGFFATAWLIVARGGWWSVPAIMEQLPIEIDTSSAGSLLWAMANRYGMLVTRGRARSREYAVTAQCVVPRGLQAGDVALALTGAPWKGAPAR